MTIAITAPSAVSRSRAHHAAHRRRRVGAAAAVVAVVALGVLGAQGVLTGPGVVPASAAGAGTAPLVARTVRAEPGDTLWGIAQVHHGSVPMRRYLDALIDRNGGTTAIQAGQLVHLP